MTLIYIPEADFANLPTRKQRREIKTAFPQIVGVTRHSGPFIHEGAQVDAGVVLETDQDPEPDTAAIVAMAIAADGTTDPPRFGVSVPLVQTEGDLPDQPPGTPDDRGFLVGVVNPPGLHVWARGAWRAL